MRRAERWPVLALLGLAFALRVVGLDFGLPGIAHNDEWQYVAMAATMLERGTPVAHAAPHEHPYINPTGFKLVAAAAALPVDAALAGGLPGGEGTRARYRARRGPYHLAARLAAALLGALTVGLVYLAARAVAAPRAALLGAALLAVSPLHVRNSHFAVSDVPMAAALAAGLVALTAYARAPTQRRALLLGACLGAACATKYNAGIFTAPVGLAVLLRAPRGRRAGHLTAAAAAAAAAFVLLFPPALLDAREFWRSFRYQASLATSPWHLQDPGWVPALHLETLVRSLGPAGLLLGLWGCVVLARRRPELVVFVPLYLLAFLPMGMFLVRFDLPLLPFLALGAAPAAEGLLRATRGSRAGQVLVLVAVFLPPTTHAVAIVRLATRPDTRLDARAWLGDRLAAGPVTVALDPGAIRFLPQAPDGGPAPGLGVLPPLFLNGRQRRLPLGEAGAEALAAGGVDVVVLTSTFLDPQPDAAELRAALERRGRLVLEVNAAAPGDARVPWSLTENNLPWAYASSRTRPGPDVWVYALDRPARRHPPTTTPSDASESTSPSRPPGGR